MGLFFKKHQKHAVSRPHGKALRARSLLRICRIEQMEPRQLLSAVPTPIHIGATYFEDSNDQDTSSYLKGTTTPVADMFQVSYTGGAAGTQLTQLTINLHDTCLFDTVAGGAGVGGAFPLTILSHDGFNLVDGAGNPISTVNVPDGATTLTLDFKDFNAGDKLVFSIDVDETIGLNAVAVGSEFISQTIVIGGKTYVAQGATLDATFTAPHMNDAPISTDFTYIDQAKNPGAEYFSGDLYNLLPNAEYSNGAATAWMPSNCSPGYVYTSGANGSVTQTPLPITIAGTVYNDLNADNQQESGDVGIAGVTLTLYELNDNGQYVATDKTTTTDSAGNYQFDQSAGILPGTYQVVETQPDGYLSVGDTPGTVAGQTDGAIATVDILSAINLDGGDNSIHNNFAETQPASLSGYVYHDVNNNGVMDLGEQGIGNVHVVVVNVATGATADAYTQDDGSWSVGGLMPGQYKVVEYQPAGYLDGLDAAGTVDGVVHGAAHNPGDLIDGVQLLGGQAGQDYDFGELLPASVSGYVYVDANNNGYYDANETPIAGVVLTLLDSSGQPTGQTATTDASGYYAFTSLLPGTYGVAETQPAGYSDGLDRPGAAGGAAHNPGDLIDGIPLTSGVQATEYDFGELLPASITGRVYADMNNNSSYDAGEPLLGGVTIYLLDASGNRTISTTTDTEGKYGFPDLTPGTYGVEEVQPTGYLEGWNQVGSAGGDQDAPDKVLNVSLGSGVDGISYDFWEVVPATISGYVFQDGPPIIVQPGDPQPDIPAIRTGKLTADDARLSGITVVLCDGSGVPMLDSQGNAISTVTDANGHYEFDGLQSGLYSVKEVRPSQYQPGVDSVGSLGGTVINKYDQPSSSAVQSLSLLNDPTGVEGFDFSGLTSAGITSIYLDPGSAATDYNFSEVLVQNGPSNNRPTPSSPMPAVPTPAAPPVPPMAPPVGVPFAGYPFTGGSYSVPEILVRPMSGGSGGPGGYSWHLSIIDAGQPRQDGSGDQFVQAPQSTLFDPVSWTGADLAQSQWVLADENGTPIKTVHFGMPGAVPVTGDWDGSGTTKVGVFMEGLWFLDLNGNGVWDKADLWAKLGKKGDQPVTGDWNGDGKTDIGIFGPAWIGDLKAVSVEPGMPDAQNPPGKSRPKNVPPDTSEAAVGWRTMKKSDRGKMRSDVIDHVFEYGTKGDIAVTGDWNGDGIYTVGIFRNGVWFLDMDGDGRWSEGDLMVEFGQEGDIPVVGDWTGDGITKLGVYRNGKFYLDTNNNHKLDATDKVIELGHAGDRPVAGDWNGDGIDKVGVYEEGVAAQPQTAATGSGAATK